MPINKNVKILIYIFKLCIDDILINSYTGVRNILMSTHPGTYTTGSNCSPIFQQRSPSYDLIKTFLFSYQLCTLYYAASFRSLDDVMKNYKN